MEVMAHLVDWRKAFREARRWVFPNTYWAPTPIPGNFNILARVSGKDCFYIARMEKLSIEICSISIDGCIRVIAKIPGGYGGLVIRSGKLFWCYLRSNKKPIHVGHTTPWQDLGKKRELTSWESTPGVWMVDEVGWGLTTTVYSPDGTRFEGVEKPVGVYRNQLVPRKGYGYNLLAGHYHLMSEDRTLWCRNLLRDGITPPGEVLPGQFFRLPYIFDSFLFLYHEGRLYNLRNAGGWSWEIRRSSVPADEYREE